MNNTQYSKQDLIVYTKLRETLGIQSMFTNQEIDDIRAMYYGMIINSKNDWLYDIYERTNHDIHKTYELMVNLQDLYNLLERKPENKNP